MLAPEERARPLGNRTRLQSRCRCPSREAWKSGWEGTTWEGVQEEGREGCTEHRTLGSGLPAALPALQSMEPDDPLFVTAGHGHTSVRCQPGAQVKPKPEPLREQG